MIDIFDIRDLVSKGTFETPVLDYQHRKQREGLAKAKIWYHDNPEFLESNHIINRIVNLARFPQSLNSVSAFYDCLANHEDICLNAGLASSVHQPKKQKYFSHDKTVIVATQDSRNSAPSPALPWREISPFKVLVRQGTEGVYQLPTSDKNKVSGLQVIGVDLPLLSFMLYKFDLEQSKKEMIDKLTTSDLITRFIIPKMLDSQFDCIMSSILMGYTIDETWDDSVPFSSPNYLDSISEELGELKATLSGKTMLAGDFLKSIPSSKGSMFDTIFSYPGANTGDSVWFETLINAPLSLAIISNVNLDNIDTVMNYSMRLSRRVKSARAWSRLNERDVGDACEILYDELFFRL